MAFLCWLWLLLAVFLGLTIAIRCWSYIRLFCGTRGRCRCSTSMIGKTVIITGATGGLGKETALNLARRGARLILACRNLEKAHLVADEIKQKTGNKDLKVYLLDVSDLTSVRQFVAKVNSDEPELHALINNAGIPESKAEKSPQALHLVMATNHYGPFLLTNLLLDLLKRSAPSRIVTLTSIGHLRCKDLSLHDLDAFRKSSSMWAPYERSKLCNILFTRELSERLKGTGVTANCVHPGVVNTNIFWKVKHPFFKILLAPLVYVFGKTAEEGCHPVVHMTICRDLSSVSGKYFVDFKESKSSRLARDPDLPGRLWSATEEIVGLF